MIMYQVKLSKRAKKELKRLDRRFADKVAVLIDMLAENPLLGFKMSGDLSGTYKIKIPPLRIVYMPDFKNKIILIRAIGFRGGGVYQNL